MNKTNTYAHIYSSNRGECQSRSSDFTYNTKILMHGKFEPNQTFWNRQDLIIHLPYVFLLSFNKSEKKTGIWSRKVTIKKKKLNKHYSWKECLIFFLPFGSFLGCCRLKKIGISIFRPQTDVLDKENVSKNTKAMCHSGFLTDRGKR